MQCAPPGLRSSPRWGVLAGSLLSVAHPGLWEFVSGICMQRASLSSTTLRLALYNKMPTALQSGVEVVLPPEAKGGCFLDSF